MTPIRYAAAACQTDLPNPVDRAQMRSNTDRILSMIDSAAGWFGAWPIGSPGSAGGGVPYS